MRFPLPDRLVSTAREFADGTRIPAEPRLAATVALLRTGAAGVEVYLLRRQTTMAFAGGMCVFPGGGVDQRDFDAAVAWAGPTPARWAEQLGVEESLAQALVCAAVRETFEESGVLLAGPDESAVVADTTTPDWEDDRAALEARELSMVELLNRRGLVLRTDLLGAWAGWLTPVFEPRRYRTWFFVAELPPGQVTRDVSSESDEVAWMSAAGAVAACDEERLFMMPPTYLTCLEIAGYADPDAARAATDARRIEIFTPTAEPAPDGVGYALSVPPRLQPLLAAHLGSRSGTSAP